MRIECDGQIGRKTVVITGADAFITRSFNRVFHAFQQDIILQRASQPLLKIV